MNAARRSGRRRQAGSTAVEFALVALMFFSLLLGILEFGRLFYTWNVMVEATRQGARLAVVCDPDAGAAVLARMRQFLPYLAADNVEVNYSPAGCNIDTCQRVEVKVVNFTVTTNIPILNATVPMPSFSTTLPRESLDSAGGANPVCA